MVVGARYVNDVDHYPIYEHMSEFHKPVTIFHGTADGMAPISYSERVVRTFPNATLVMLNGAGYMVSSHANIIERNIIMHINFNDVLFVMVTRNSDKTRKTLQIREMYLKSFLKNYEENTFLYLQGLQVIG